MSRDSWNTRADNRGEENSGQGVSYPACLDRSFRTTRRGVPQAGHRSILLAVHDVAGAPWAGAEGAAHACREMEAARYEQCRGWVGFNVSLAHRITAGADMLLMPSRFEPCGLNQLYAMAYGTVPIVHAVSPAPLLLRLAAAHRGRASATTAFRQSSGSSGLRHPHALAHDTVTIPPLRTFALRGVSACCRDCGTMSETMRMCQKVTHRPSSLW